MTKKEFKAAMLRGLGRCVTAVRQEPQRYRDVVLWACRRDISYDAQCEGTRAWYVYAMADCYPDKETFIQAAAEALKKYRPKGGWELLHLSELLMRFARDGYDSARNALEEKYRELLAAMHKRKRRPQGVFYELDDLEQLGLVLAEDRATCLRIAGDFGRLYREKPYMLDGDFAWFFSDKGDRFKKTLERAAKKNENIACFLQREQANKAAREESWEQRRALPPEMLSGIRLSRWLVKKADKETVERYAAAYREEKLPQQRAQALEVFVSCPYPDDPRPVIEDTRSTCEELQNTAWRVLENLRHPAVRTFALSNIGKGIRTPENFALLANNYKQEDGALMEDLLREMIAAKDFDCVHAAGRDIYRAFRNDSGISRPKHLLPLLYEYNPCSFCRESAIACMSRHRMLTEEIIEECLYDSNDDIRRYAAKRLSK